MVLPLPIKSFNPEIDTYVIGQWMYADEPDQSEHVFAYRARERQVIESNPFHRMRRLWAPLHLSQNYVLAETGQSLTATGVALLAEQAVHRHAARSHSSARARSEPRCPECGLTLAECWC